MRSGLVNGPVVVEVLAVAVGAGRHGGGLASPVKCLAARVVVRRLVDREVIDVADHGVVVAGVFPAAATVFGLVPVPLVAHPVLVVVLDRAPVAQARVAAGDSPEVAAGNLVTYGTGVEDGFLGAPQARVGHLFVLACAVPVVVVAVIGLQVGHRVLDRIGDISRAWSAAASSH